MQVKAGKCFNTFHRLSYTSFCFSLFKNRKNYVIYEDFGGCGKKRERKRNGADGKRERGNWKAEGRGRNESRGKGIGGNCGTRHR